MSDQYSILCDYGNTDQADYTGCWAGWYENASGDCVGFLHVDGGKVWLTDLGEPEETESEIGS